MRNLLVLGGFGFIGTNLLKYIDNNLLNSYNVIVFDKFSSHSKGITFECISKVYEGDFSDELIIERIFVENKIDLVLHLLSSTVPVNSRNAKYDVMTNLIPTLGLLSIMDYHHVKDIVYMSSGGAVYGDILAGKHKEDDAVYPKSSYGVVKLAVEKYLLSYSELFGFNSLILRLSNPYGPYHYNMQQGICNVALKKALMEETIQIWGTGEGRKDYIYIDDVCSIIFKLISQGVKTDVINLGNGNTLSVNEIVDGVKSFIPEIKVEHINDTLLDVTDFELDISKMINYIGDFQFTDFNTGINNTYEWIKKSI